MSAGESDSDSGSVMIVVKVGSASTSSGHILRVRRALRKTPSYSILSTGPERVQTIWRGW